MTFCEEINKLKEQHPNLIIIAVTKTQTAQKIIQLPTQITHIAENKVQEAELKFRELDQQTTRKFTKHYIGRIQSNKISKIVKLFNTVQSIESFQTAQKISNQAVKQNKQISIMLQINIDCDKNKQGLQPNKNEIIKISKQIQNLPNIKIIGLMTILENTQDIIATQNSFKKMQNLFNELNKHIIELKFLSMGMSDDYQIALQNGSNMIRIGRKLFIDHD